MDKSRREEAGPKSWPPSLKGRVATKMHLLEKDDGKSENSHKKAKTDFKKEFKKWHNG
jgi:hypothetical protein